MAGNLYGYEVEAPRNDARYGVFLKGNGTGRFMALLPNSGGLGIQCEVKHMVPIKVLGKKAILIAINNGKLALVDVGKNEQKD